MINHSDEPDLTLWPLQVKKTTTKKTHTAIHRQSSRAGQARPRPLSSIAGQPVHAPGSAVSQFRLLHYWRGLAINNSIVLASKSCPKRRDTQTPADSIVQTL